MSNPTNFVEANLFLLACEGDLDAVRRLAAEIEKDNGEHTLEYIRRGASFLLSAIKPHVDLSSYLEQGEQS
jgi:hypothetical protein